MDCLTEEKTTDIIYNLEVLDKKKNAFNTYIFKTFAEPVEQTKKMLFKCANVANPFLCVNYAMRLHHIFSQ